MSAVLLGLWLADYQVDGFAQTSKVVDHASPVVTTDTLVAQPLASLTLIEAERLLLEVNADIALSQAALAGAQAQIDMAGARPNPTLAYAATSINPSAGVGAGGYYSKRVDNVLQLSQVFERGDKRQLRIQAAQQAQQAATQDWVDTQRRLRLNLAASYIDLLATQARSQVAKESADLARRALAAAETRQRAGDLAGADVARIRTDNSRAANEAIQADLDLARARIALNSLLGNRVPAARLVLADNWPELLQTYGVNTAPLDAQTMEQFLAQRPDVQAAQARLAQADALRDLARSQRTRDVTVGVQAEHYPPAAGHTYGMVLSVPLLIGNDYRGDIAKSEADRSAAEIELERTRNNASSELAGLQADYQAHLQRYQQLRDEGLPAAEKAGKAAEIAFRNGAVGLSDFLDAARTLRATRLEAIQSHADLAKAWYALYLVTPKDSL